MGKLCSVGEAQGWLTVSGVSYTNEGRGAGSCHRLPILSASLSLQEQATNNKVLRVSSTGCWSTEITSSEGESVSARRRVPPPHRQEMPWHGACSYRPALPMGAERTPRKLKDHGKDHEKHIKGNTWPIFLLPHILGVDGYLQTHFKHC